MYYALNGNYPEEYLEHHGVKGQKWGVRRYQNEDGSLTAAGKKRYGEGENFNEKKYDREQKVHNAAVSVNNKVKKTYEMGTKISTGLIAGSATIATVASIISGVGTIPVTAMAGSALAATGAHILNNWTWDSGFVQISSDNKPKK